jgi:hypothetical protein
MRKVQGSKSIKTIYFSCVYIFSFCGGEEILKIFDRYFAINTRKGGEEGGRWNQFFLISRKSNINQSHLLMPAFNF